MIDAAGPALRWIPPERREVAAKAGALASYLMLGGYAVVLMRRRARTFGPGEIGVLFLFMFLPIPWNHDYYYIFAVAPISVLVLESLARKRTVMLAVHTGGLLSHLSTGNIQSHRPNRLVFTALRLHGQSAGLVPRGWAAASALLDPTHVS